MNFLSKNQIFNSFVDTLLLSKLSKVKTLLFKNSSIYNIEYISNLLVFSENWVYFYYIPSKKYNENYLLLGFSENSNIDKLVKILKPETQFNDVYKILNIFSYEPNWLETDLNNHSCKWIDQQFFALFLDEISGGFINFLPNHWGQPFEKKKDLITLETYQLYINYLNDNSLIDTSENKLNFLLTNK